MTPKLVNYDYIAAELDIAVETVRRYASQAARQGKYPHFPKAVDPDARSPLFRQEDADYFIIDHRGSMEGEKRRGRPRTNSSIEPQPLVMSNAQDLVGREYFAEKLGVDLVTINVYAAKAAPHYLDDFPDPVTPRSHRKPQYRRQDADKFIANRLKRSAGNRGRLRAQAVTEQAKGLANALEAQLGIRVDFESRADLQHLLFNDLKLPETYQTDRGLSVSTPALLRLYRVHPHPVLASVLHYRLLTTESDWPGAEIADAGTYVLQLETINSKIDSANARIDKLRAKLDTLSDAPAGDGRSEVQRAEVMGQIHKSVERLENLKLRRDLVVTTAFYAGIDVDDLARISTLSHDHIVRLTSPVLV